MSVGARSASVLRGITWLGASSLLQSAFRVLLLVLLARLVTPDAYGLIALSTAVVALVEILCRLGIDSALVQAKNLSDEAIGAAASFCFYAGLLSMTLILVFADALSLFLGATSELTNVLWVVSIVIPVNSLSVGPRARLTRCSEFRYIATAELFSYLLASFVVALPMAIAGFGVWSLVLAIVAQAIATLILLARRAPVFPTWPIQRSHVQPLIAFGVPLTGAKLANFVALQSDNFIVGKFLGMATLGAYSRAYALNTFPATLLGQSVERSLLPAMSAARSDLGSAERALMRGMIPLVIVFAPMSAYCFLFAEQLVDILLGSQWAEAVLPFQILSLAMYFRVAYKLPDVLLCAEGQTSLLMRVHVLYAVLVICAALVGVRFGVGGVAAGVAIAIVFQYCQAMYLAVRIIRIRGFRLLTVHVIGLAIGGASYACLMYASPAIHGFISSPLLAGVVILACLYLALVVLLKPMFREHGEWWHNAVGAVLRGRAGLL